MKKYTVVNLEDFKLNRECESFMMLKDNINRCLKINEKERKKLFPNGGRLQRWTSYD